MKKEQKQRERGGREGSLRKGVYVLKVWVGADSKKRGGSIGKRKGNLHKKRNQGNRSRMSGTKKKKSVQVESRGRHQKHSSRGKLKRQFWRLNMARRGEKESVIQESNKTCYRERQRRAYRKQSWKASVYEHRRTNEMDAGRNRCLSNGQQGCFGAVSNRGEVLQRKPEKGKDIIRPRLHAGRSIEEGWKNKNGAGGAAGERASSVDCSAKRIGRRAKKQGKSLTPNSTGM